MDATVIKIEPFGGQPIRWRSAGDMAGGAFLMLNGGKQGLRLDLKKPEGREFLLELARSADVLVENFADGVIERLHLGWDTLHAVAPRLVFASGRAFGDHPAAASLRGMEVTVQAVAGFVTTTGPTEGPPSKAGPSVVDSRPGRTWRRRPYWPGSSSGSADRPRSAHRGRAAGRDPVRPDLEHRRVPRGGRGLPGARRQPSRGLAVCPYNIYPAEDRWIAMLYLRTRHLSALCDLMDRPDLPAIRRSPLLRGASGTWTDRRRRDPVDGAVDDPVSSSSSSNTPTSPPRRSVARRGDHRSDPA